MKLIFEENYSLEKILLQWKFVNDNQYLLEYLNWN